MTAVDLNPTQTALLHLKVAGIKNLFYDEFITLIGARTGRSRWSLYEFIREDLPDDARTYWDKNRPVIESGILAAGKLEQYFESLRKQVVVPYVSSKALQGYLSCSRQSEQSGLFRSAFSSSEFRHAFEQQTTRETISESGRDPTQFKFVEIENTGAFFFERFKEVGLSLPPRSNFYYEYFLTSHYRDLSVGPPYLRQENFLKLRNLLPRLEIVTAGIDECIRAKPHGHFSQANLSDIFEYLSEDETHGLMKVLAENMREGGHLAYWNHLVPRQRPESLKSLLNPNPQLAQDLYARDRFFSYRAFHVDQVSSD